MKKEIHAAAIVTRMTAQTCEHGKPSQLSASQITSINPALIHINYIEGCISQESRVKTKEMGWGSIAYSCKFVNAILDWTLQQRKLYKLLFTEGEVLHYDWHTVVTHFQFLIQAVKATITHLIVDQYAENQERYTDVWMYSGWQSKNPTKYLVWFNKKKEK